MRGQRQVEGGSPAVEIVVQLLRGLPQQRGGRRGAFQRLGATEIEGDDRFVLLEVS